MNARPDIANTLKRVHGIPSLLMNVAHENGYLVGFVTPPARRPRRRALYI
jgi:hypothetical protein